MPNFTFNKTYLTGKIQKFDNSTLVSLKKQTKVLVCSSIEGYLIVFIKMISEYIYSLTQQF